MRVGFDAVARAVSTSWTLVTVGVLFGALVCADPPLGRLLGLTRFPYLLSTALAIVFAIAGCLAFGLRRGGGEGGGLLLIGAIAALQFGGIGFGPFDVVELATLIIAAVWLVRATVEGRRELYVSPLFFPMLGLLLLACLALPRGAPLSGLVVVGMKILYFLLVVDLIRNRAMLPWLVQVVVAAGAFTALVGILQSVLWWKWGILLTIGKPEDNPATFLKPTPFGWMPRATGFHPNPAMMNDFLLLAVSLAAFGLVGAKSRRGRLAYALAILLMTVTIVLSWSASALIGLGCIAVLFLYIHRPSLSIHYTCALLAAALVGIQSGLLAPILKLTTAIGGTTERLPLLGLAMESLERNPLVGVGVKNFGSVSGNFFPVGPYIFKYPVHNALLQAATELGIVGGMLFAGILACILLRLLTVVGDRQSEVQWVSKGFLLATFPILVHMMTEPMAFAPPLWLAFGLMEGSSLAILREQRSTSSRATDLVTPARRAPVR